jgi:hypothetical protein
MAVPYTIRKMMRDAIVVEPPIAASSSSSGVNAWGVTYYTAATTYPCRTVWTPKNVVNGQGETVVSAGHAIIGQDVKIDPRSRITLSSMPNGCTSGESIITVTYSPDRMADGLSHPTVYF